MQRTMRGKTLIDVVVGTALILIVFLGLFGLIRASVDVVQLTKAKAVATTIAESQMEYVRSLSYGGVGTVGGIPSGIIPQNSTTTSNGVAYGVRTFIDYADDPADGLGAADTNGIITDYKRVKVTVNYTAGGQPRTVVLISNYSPIGLETTTGGGTLKIVVVSASGTGVSGASVHIVNTVLGVDVTTFSDSTGVVYLPGALPSSQYQIYVTKAGYSSAQTYLRDSTNQNPTPGYLTVSMNLTTTGTFAIDVLSALTMHTYTPVATTTYTDSFSNGSNLASQINTQITGSSITLANGGSGYALSGTAVSNVITPTYLVSWKSASTTSSMPAGTTAALHIVDGSGTLLPDSVLSGNSTGFTAPVDLSAVSTTTYPTLALRADLTTNATTTTPLVQDWGLSYARGPIPLANVPFTLTGAKTVGSTGAGAPIYKTTVSTTTDSTGTNPLSLQLRHGRCL
jgi:type II secretory pathway pseudopilin PulG